MSCANSPSLTPNIHLPVIWRAKVHDWPKRHLRRPEVNYKQSQKHRNDRFAKTDSSIIENFPAKDNVSASKAAFSGGKSKVQNSLQNEFNRSHDKPLPPTPTHHKNDDMLITREVSLSPQRRKRSNSSNLMQSHQQIVGSRNSLSNIGKQASAPEVGFHA